MMLTNIFLLCLDNSFESIVGFCGVASSNSMASILTTNVAVESSFYSCSNTSCCVIVLVTSYNGVNNGSSIEILILSFLVADIDSCVIVLIQL